MPQYIGGRHAVYHAIKAGRRKVHKLIIQAGICEEALESLIGEASSMGISIETGTKEFFAQNVNLQTHQGVTALVDEISYISLDLMIENTQSKETSRILLLDGIEDPHNLGALLRSALSFGIHGVIWPQRRSASLTATAVKAAAGAVEYIPLARVNNLVKSIEEMKKAGFWIYGSVAEGGKILWEESFSEAAALVVGGEGRGLKRLVRQKCDVLLSIPTEGPLESLNASVAGGILMAAFSHKFSPSSIP